MVCKNEIGNEIIEDILKVKKEDVIIVDTNNISSIASYVQSNFADIALADSLSCFEFLKKNSDSDLRLVQFNPPISISFADTLFVKIIKKIIKNLFINSPHISS